MLLCAEYVDVSENHFEAGEGMEMKEKMAVIGSGRWIAKGGGDGGRGFLLIEEFSAVPTVKRSKKCAYRCDRVGVKAGILDVATEDLEIVVVEGWEASCLTWDR